MRPFAFAAAAFGAILAFAACQSTQDRSAELAKQGSTVLEKEQGLKVTQRSADVKVVSSTVLSDVNGSAVVLGLRNDSSQTLTDVPIQVKVLDAKGRVVYTNTTPGLEPNLTSMPIVPPGDSYWVNDQVLATGKPKTVKAEVGAGGSTLSGELPDIEVGPPKLEQDPVSGLDVRGTVVNKTGKEQGPLLLFAVAKQGSKVVAAGRGGIDHLKPSTKALHYTIFFIGDPKGAKVDVTSFPTVEQASSSG
ncbi:MAG: hypothetical protein U0R52_07760 [Solirubrobacterales bacterium]